MSAQTIATMIFWNVFLVSALWETGFVPRGQFPYFARVSPGVIGRFLVQGMARAYAKDNSLVIDFDWLFSKEPSGLGSPFYRELVRLLQFLLAGSWLSIYIFGMADGLVT